MAAKRYNGTTQGTSNISESVYNILYKNIVNLNLVPGAMISEKEIADKLKVSRTPVREAFIRLSHQALVSIIPQKGTFVSRIDLSRVQEERFLREALESAVLKLFVSSHTDKSIERLRSNLLLQQSAIEDNSIAKFIDYDDQFHAIFFEETRKELCYNAIQSFSSHYHRIRYLSMFISNVSSHNVEQHRLLADAAESHDVQEADKILKEHIHKLTIEKDEICKKYPAYFQQEEPDMDEATIFSTTNELQKLLSDRSLFSVD